MEERSKRPLLGAARANARPGLDQAVTLGRLIPPLDQWRLYPDLREEARFIDIETEGLGEEDPITLLGIACPCFSTVLVAGRDLTRRRLVQELAGARLLVTFNGRAFDLPRLRRAFPGLPCWELPHIDLAPLGRRVGLSGGLQAIERRVGYRRPPAVQELNGLEAVRLWREHQAGEPGALTRLVRYCRADTVSLVTLADLIYERLARQSAQLADGADDAWLRRESRRVPVPPLHPPPLGDGPKVRLASA